MEIKLKLLLTLLFTVVIISGCRKSNYKVPDFQAINDDGSGTGTVTWVEGNDYVIEGFVFVNDGQVLTIEPGVVVRAKTGQAENASALIVARGGKIIAKGTAEKPIIFTVEGDDLNGSIPVDAKGLWGGLIVLGAAPLNVSGNEAFIEGIPDTEPRGVFGGEISNDNSGVLEYVSIRHGGTNIGMGNEINGLTLGGVGSETTINHVEIISNADDGIEFFGGTVSFKYVAVAFCGDDAFDFDMGYNGNGQFLLAIQDTGAGNLIIETDGSPSHPVMKPYTLPQINNFTAVGRGIGNGEGLVSFASNSAGKIANSIFIDQQFGVSLQYDAQGQSSLQQWQNGNLTIQNNTFYSVAADTPKSIFTISGDDPGSTLTQQWADYFYQANNQIENPGFIINSNSYYLFPSAGFTGETIPPDNPWFDNVNYQGAFKNVDWLLGWSLLSQEGIVVSN